MLRFHRFRWLRRRIGSTAAAALSTLVFSFTSHAQLCQTPVGDFAKAGRVLRSMAYGPTPDLLTDLAQSGTGSYASIDQWVDEQLRPAVITEPPDLAPLISQLQADPMTNSLGIGPHPGFPVEINRVAWHQIIRGIYSDKQLLEKLVWFWENHFTTDYNKVNQGVGAKQQTAAWLEHDENELFRARALQRFKRILRVSATSPTMLIYLDSVKSVAGNINENYARELLELHCTGRAEGEVVDNEVVYTAEDIIDVARVFTGWTIGQKAWADYGDPNAPLMSQSDISDFAVGGDFNRSGYIDQFDCDCIDNAVNLNDPDEPCYGLPLDPNGDMLTDSNDITFVCNRRGEILWSWSFHFDPNTHDMSQYPLTLFGGSSHMPQLQIAQNLNNWPDSAVESGYQLLDYLANLPITSEFVSSKLYNFFVRDIVSDQDEPQSIDVMVNAWGATGGRIRDVLDRLFGQDDFLNPAPNEAGQKVFDAFESSLAAVRAYDGTTPNLAPIKDTATWLNIFQGYRPFRYPPPDGRPEQGSELVASSSMLQQIRFNQHTWDTTAPPPGQPDFPGYDYDFVGLMTANGVTLNDPDCVARFFFRIVFQDDFTQEDLDLAVLFLITDASGAAMIPPLDPLSPNYPTRIAKFAGFVSSLAQSAQH